MAKRPDDFLNDSMIDVVNANDDNSTDALTTWLAELERDADWIDLPTTAAELISEDRGSRGS